MKRGYFYNQVSNIKDWNGSFFAQNELISNFLSVSKPNKDKNSQKQQRKIFINFLYKVH